MHYAILAHDKPDHLEVRKANRDAHLAYLERFAVVFGGPLLDQDGATMIGSLLVVELDGPDALAAFLAGDPYAQAGLFAHVETHPVRRVIPA